MNRCYEHCMLLLPKIILSRSDHSSSNSAALCYYTACVAIIENDYSKFYRGYACKPTYCQLCTFLLHRHLCAFYDLCHMNQKKSVGANFLHRIQHLGEYIFSVCKLWTTKNGILYEKRGVFVGQILKVILKAFSRRFLKISEIPGLSRAWKN